MTTAIHEETLLDALRSNVRVLGELAMRYGIETQPGRPAEDRPTISSAEDVDGFWPLRWPRLHRSRSVCSCSTSGTGSSARR